MGKYAISWWGFTWQRMAWLYGYDHASAVFKGADPDTEADIARWTALGGRSGGMIWRNSNEARVERNVAAQLAVHADDLIRRYVVGRESLRELGKRYGVGHEAVRAYLHQRGVEMREPGGGWSTSTAARQERRDRAARDESATAHAAPDDEDHWARADHRHVALILRALNPVGRQTVGFPLYGEEALRRAGL